MPPNDEVTLHPGVASIAPALGSPPVGLIEDSDKPQSPADRGESTTPRVTQKDQTRHRILL
jgi:hypothetical protein